MAFNNKKQLLCQLFFSIFIIIVTTSVVYSTNINLKLRAAAVISRHGSREKLEKDDRHHFTESTSPQLTKRGKAQLFEAGQFLRHRYISDSSHDNPNINMTLTGLAAPRDAGTASQVFVQSTNFDRTLLSAQNLLLGLFPPTVKNCSADDFYLNMQQIPIHATENTRDRLLRGWTQCEQYKNDMRQFYHTDEFIRRNKSTEAIWKSLSGVAVLNNMELSLSNMFNIYDTLLIEKTYNSSFHINDITWMHVEKLAHWLEYKKYSRSMTGSFGGGLLIYRILSQFQAASHDEGNILAYYSAHYPTIVSILSALDVKESENDGGIDAVKRIPPYASLLLFEFIEDTSVNNMYIRIIFRDGISGEVMSVPLPSCSIEGSAVSSILGNNTCEFEHFKKLVNVKVTVRSEKDWEKICGYDSLTVYPSNGFKIVTVVCLVVFVIAIIFLAVYRYRQYKTPKSSRRHIRLEEAEAV